MWNKVLILVLTVFIKECLTCSDDPQCLYGSKYVLVQMTDRGTDSPVSWSEAEQYCVDVYNTHLASIHSAEDAADSIRACKRAVGIDKCWIGLSDASDETRWTYTDGTPVDHLAWAPGEPTGNLVSQAEDCVFIAPEKNYGWNDFDCGGDFRGIQVFSFLCNNPDYNPELECRCECDVCQIEGDPHITTFDKLLYHFMGECTYLYVTPCFNNYNELPIEISGSHVQCFDNRDDRTCLDKVYINLYNNNQQIAAQLKLGENYFAEWTGVGTLGWTGAAALNEYITWSTNPTRQLYLVRSITNVLDVQFYLFDTTEHEIMDARVQIARDYNPNGWGAFVNIWLAQCYADDADVCGLCGHYDFNALNDFAYVDNNGNLLEISTEGVSVVKSMTQDAWDRTHLFGEKWINEDLTEQEDCEVIGSPPDSECATIVEDYCKTFWNTECACPYEYPNNYYNLTWFEGCVWDTCSLCSELNWPDVTYEEALQAGCFAFANVTCTNQCREIDTYTLQPTPLPTSRPTSNPTPSPTDRPTPRPTPRPTTRPTNSPTPSPTDRPTPRPTLNPTAQPTLRPTPRPTLNPTPQPSLRPTPRPTLNPTPQPSLRPTPRPTLNPTLQPTPRPTLRPTQVPSAVPTSSPIEVPIASVTTETPDYWWHWVTQKKPTSKPTSRPIPIETEAETTTLSPTSQPTLRPTLRPTSRPTARPTARPTLRPTRRPTTKPTETDDYWYHWKNGKSKNKNSKSGN